MQYLNLFIETQCIAEELIEEAVTGALSELYIEIEDKLRLGAALTINKRLRSGISSSKS